MLWHNVVEARADKTKTCKKHLCREFSVCAKQCSKWMILYKDVLQRRGNVPDNKKKCQVEIRKRDNHSLSSHTDCVMSSETHYQFDYPCKKMLKVIYGGR